MNNLNRFFILATITLATSFCHAAGLEIEMQEDWALKISHPDSGILCNFSKLSILSEGHRVYYSRQMGDYWHENTPVNKPGLARLVQFEDAKSSHWFRLTDYSARLSENGETLTIHIAGEMQNSEKGLGEYALLCLPKYLADGATFRAVAADGSILEGKVPDQDSQAFLATGCRSLDLVMACGTLHVQVLTGEPLTLLDRRLGGMEIGKCLFLGILSRDMDTPLNSTVTLSFTPDARHVLTKPLPVQADAAVRRVPVAFQPVSRDYRVNTQCIVPKEFEDLGEAEPCTVPFAVSYPPLPEEDHRRLEKAVKHLGILPAPLTLRLLDGAVQNDLPEDGFVIERGAEEITVSGGTPRAIFYGIQALRDLDLGRRFHLRDWPDMAFRGLSMYLLTDDAWDFTPFFMREVWTRGRLNTLIIGCNSVAWETVPELWETLENPPKKDHLRQFIQECRDNYIEPVPFMNFFSHTDGWLFRDGNYLELAEDPATPYNYNVNDPRVFELLKPLLDEVIELFQPKWFHICHDEIDRARTLVYPTRPENQALGMAELYRRSVWQLHDYFAKRNIKTMLWGDGMCAATEGEWGLPADMTGDIQAFRATLPNDLVVMLWQYDDGKTYGGLGQLQKEGFTAIGCPWYKEGNIRQMVADAKKFQATGVCGTTWSPMYTWEYLARVAYPYQYAAQLLTPCLAWGGERQDAIPLRRYADIVYNLMYQQVTLDKTEEASGYAMDLSPVANYCPEKEDPLLGADFTSVLKPGQTLKIGRGEFVVPERDGRLAAVAMQSFPDGIHFPQSVALPVSGNIRVLHLLGALTGEVPAEHSNCQALDVVFHYEEGETATKTLQYNLDVGHVHGRASYALNQTTAVEGIGGRLWDNAVENPSPEKAVAFVELLSRDRGFVLFGVSCEEFSAP